MVGTGAELAEKRAAAAEDASPCEVANPEGGARVLFVCDHASADMPDAFDGLGLEETALCRHIAWDIGAADVARRLAARFDAPLVLTRFSRLIIDPNRALDDPTSIPMISDGVVIPGNRELDGATTRARAERFFRPYHDAIEEQLAAIEARSGTPALVSVHSFTPVFKGVERPWHVGILWNRDGRIAEPLMDILRAEKDVVVGDNEPYSARDNYGYTIEAHAETRGLPHVLIELRQDLVDTHHGAEAWAARIGDALEACFLRRPGIFEVRRF